jgi:hypothetical protein
VHFLHLCAFRVLHLSAMVEAVFRPSRNRKLLHPSGAVLLFYTWLAYPLGWLCEPETENAYFLRRTLKAMPAIPIPIRDSVLGSGTGAPGVVIA